MGAHVSNLVLGGAGAEGMAGLELPPLVLIVEDVIWRGGVLPYGEAAQASASAGGATSSAAWSPRVPAGAAPLVSRCRAWRVLVTAAVDGEEVGRVWEVPSAPVRLSIGLGGRNPTLNSRLSLSVFFLSSTQHSKTEFSAGVECPMAELAGFGAPLLASLWLGLPSLGGPPGSARCIGLREALDCAQDPEVPKVVVSVLRAPRNQFPPSTPCGLETPRRPQPDIAAALAEEVELCGANRRVSGLSPAQQVQGLVTALSATSATAVKLQRALFSLPEVNAEGTDVPPSDVLVERLAAAKAEADHNLGMLRRVQQQNMSLEMELDYVKSELWKSHEAAQQAAPPPDTGELDMTLLQDTPPGGNPPGLSASEVSALRAELASLKRELAAEQEASQAQGDRLRECDDELRRALDRARALEERQQQAPPQQVCTTPRTWEQMGTPRGGEGKAADEEAMVLRMSCLDERRQREELEAEQRRLQSALDAASEAQSRQYDECEVLRSELEEARKEAKETKAEVASTKKALRSAAEVRKELEAAKAEVASLKKALKSANDSRQDSEAELAGRCSRASEEAPQQDGAHTASAAAGELPSA